jgi:hypothetical protein
MLCLEGFRLCFARQMMVPDGKPIAFQQVERFEAIWADVTRHHHSVDLGLSVF